MNRRFLAAALLCAVAAMPSGAATILPGIGGTVQRDGLGVAIPGVTVQLYQDDGDGAFDPDIDRQIGSNVLTDADGAYGFDQLDVDAGYFVYRPAQQIQGDSLGADVSGLLSPGVPLLIIDEFDTHQIVHANPMTPSATSAINDPMSSAIGGERDLLVELMSGVGEVSLRSNAFGVEVLQYDTTSGVTGRGLVTWDGVDFSASETPALGLGNVDLTDGGQATGLLLQLGVDQTGTGESLHFRFFRDSTTEYSEGSVEIPVTGGTATGTAFLPFEGFVGPVTPDDVNAIQMFLGEGSKSIDAQVAWIGTAAPTIHDFVVVPEPTAAGLTMLALLLLGGFRRRS
jgi:hypothetical protein